MAKLKAGFIGFMPFFDPKADIYELLKSYAKLGFKGFEGGDMLLRGGDPAENLKRVKEFGIEPITLGYMKKSFPDGRDVTIGEMIENAHKLGVKRITTFMGIVGGYRFGNLKEPPSYDEVMKELEEYEAAATACKKEGIELAFHNHDIELKMSYKGVPVLYLMAAYTDNLKFELDVGWCLYGGKDPSTVMRDLGDRLCNSIHVKDFIPGVVEQERREGGVNIMPRFVTPGTGLLNINECLETASQLGVEWAVLEQDFQYNLTQAETLTASYLIMKESGFVE